MLTKDTAISMYFQSRRRYPIPARMTRPRAKKYSPTSPAQSLFDGPTSSTPAIGNTGC